MQTDLFCPPLAKFEVVCRPSGRKMYVRAASFDGAKRAAKDNQLRGKKDREFFPAFICWERGYFEKRRDGVPPKNFEWPDFHE